jgi:hypothetical protein
MEHHKKRYRSHKGTVFIDLKLRQLSQLFDSRDPSPFVERDLDDNAVDYIVSSTMEHSIKTPIELVIHLSDMDAFPIEPKIIVDSIHNHFDYDAELMQKKTSRIFKQGQLGILVGVIILFICLSVSQIITPETEKSYLSVLKEGLVIMGWVGMWRPIDLFLYSWWPQVEMRRVFLKLSKIPVEIKVQSKSVETPALNPSK